MFSLIEMNKEVQTKGFTFNLQWKEGDQTTLKEINHSVFRSFLLW